MKVKLMHQLIEASDMIFQSWTNEVAGKDIGNDFWTFVRSQMLTDGVKKIKVFDFVYDHILHLDSEAFQKKFGVSLENIKKSKDQLTFVSEIVSKMIKHSDIPLIDY